MSGNFEYKAGETRTKRKERERNGFLDKNEETH